MVSVLFAYNGYYYYFLLEPSCNGLKGILLTDGHRKDCMYSSLQWKEEFHTLPNPRQHLRSCVFKDDGLFRPEEHFASQVIGAATYDESSEKKKETRREPLRLDAGLKSWQGMISQYYLRSRRHIAAEDVCQVL